MSTRAKFVMTFVNKESKVIEHRHLVIRYPCRLVGFGSCASGFPAKCFSLEQKRAVEIPETSRRSLKKTLRKGPATLFTTLFLFFTYELAQ